MIQRLRRSKVFRFTASLLLINLLADIFYSTGAYALTSGPGSPEFASFEPVATTDMVNLFSGDFNYNLPVLEIPGPDGGGYAMSLSYHSGASSEEEASWVGYGWNLNPGAINRNTRGFPDDYKDIQVNHYNKTRPNWSGSMTNSTGVELFSKDASKEGQGTSKPDGDSTSKGPSIGGITASATLRYNNYQGFSRYYGFGVDVKGMANLGMNIGAEGTTYSAGVNISGIINESKKWHKKTKETLRKTPENKFINRIGAQWKSKALSQASRGYGSTYGIYTFSEAMRATSVSRYQGASYNWSIGLSVNPSTLPVGFQVGATGNFNLTSSEKQGTYQAFGYMHNQATGSGRRLGDYYVERGNSYHKRDLYLGIPFGNADNFMVTGEGLAGGFRFYPEKNGHFFPDFAENTTKIQQTGFDLSVGGNIGVGVNFGVGWQKAATSEWESPVTNFTSINQYRFSGSQGVFRFNNDMGGSITYGNSNLTSASLNNLSFMPGTKDVEPVLDAQALNATFDQVKATSSSFIRYNTYAATQDSSQRLNKRSTQGSRQSGMNADGIAEIAVTNTDGTHYIYGLPAYNRNETSLQFDVSHQEVPADRYLAYKNIALGKNGAAFEVNTSNHATVIGEVRKVPYASSYLLTQIVTPDYVDVNNNGADSLDFGGWTQFHYHQTHGGAANWYRWRAPYNGLLYSKNQLSDTRDDLGALTTGEKEVYYLNAVETKTHIAFFVTNTTTESSWTPLLTKLNLQGLVSTGLLKGSGKTRLDGLGAALLSATQDPAAGSRSAKGNQTLEYLEKIVLFSKSRPDQPLKTTHFQYDYSLVRNLPNHANSTFPNARVQSAGNAETGKLTLKKVWFEYEGIVNSRISPYEFQYKYKDYNSFPEYIRAQYPEATAVNNRYTDAAQNPDYAPHLLDAWGNLQAYGKERKRAMMPWIYQGPMPAIPIPGRGGWQADLSTVPQGAGNYLEYDPGAWQLKQIKLPSGGEILVEYEQKDYAYVQDRAPMAMAALLQASEPMNGGEYGSFPTYTINTRDLGLDPSALGYADQLAEQKQALIDYFKKEKVYFKFLYALTNRRGGADLESCMSEYITGYAVVDSLGVTTRAVPVNGVTETHLQLTLKGEKKDGYVAVPRQACYDYYSTQRMGKWNGSDCSSEIDEKYDARVKQHEAGLLSGDLSARWSVATPLMLYLEENIGLLGNQYPIPSRKDVATDLNLPLSFLKLPMIKAKRGGGIRVKRLLIYDPGIENGDAALYGQEYHYQDFKEVNGKLRVISSGVATNEPSDAREENPLVGFLPRKGQSWFSRITAGSDLEQTEGPLGESILPGASVGHSRVVVKNIHGGPTGTGFTEQAYFTVKDYPFDGIYKQAGPHSDLPQDALGVDKTSLNDNQVKDYLVIPAGLFYYEVNKAWAAQGYRFLINTMHGQVRKVATYGGDYDLVLNQEYAASVNTRFQRISEQTYQYYQPGEQVKMLSPDGRYTWESPGKEMELAMEMKTVSDRTVDLGIEIDISIGLMAPPPVFVTAFPNFSYTDRGFSTHVTTKIIRYPAIVKSITAFHDGVTSTTENLAFNPATGQPVVTRTADGFDGVKAKGVVLDGSTYSVQLPASWYYPELGQKSKNASNWNQLSATAGSLVTYGTRGNPLRGNRQGADSLQHWGTHPFRDVLSASAQTYSRYRSADTAWFPASGNAIDTKIAADYSINAANRIQLNAMLRPKSSYVYRADVLAADAGNRKIYNSGMIDQLNLFRDWHRAGATVADQSNWILGSQVTHYSPNGNAIEEKNVLNVYSTARFGYGNLLPVVVANNSRYSSVYFEDYENAPLASPIMAHSGKKSQQVNTASITLVPNLTVNSHLLRTGALLKAWIKSGAPNSLSLQINGVSLPFTQVAMTGEWSLYQADILPTLLPPAVNTSFSITLINSGNLFVDDVRFQPKDAQATCYVYDVKTLRLLTQFDDQHFGLYYQYNAEGKLVRKLIETERGLKTIQETQYNLPKTSR